MKNSNGDIEFEIIDDGLDNMKWKVSEMDAGEVEEKIDRRKKMVITGPSTNKAADEERAKDNCIKGEFKVGSDEINEYCKKNWIVENKTKQNNTVDIFLEDKERLKCIKEQVGDVIKAEEDCKQNGTPFIDAYKEARKQSFKNDAEKENSAIEDPYTEKRVCCGNKAELVMNKMAIIYDFIDSLRDDLTIAEVKRRFF